MKAWIGFVGLKVGVGVIYGVILITLSANPGRALEGDLLIDQNGLVSYTWKSRDGYGYRLESTADLGSWEAVGTFVGTGGTISVPVVQLDASGNPNPPPANPPDTHSAQFVLRTFAGMNKTLVAWRQSEGSALSQALVDADFSAIDSLPMFHGSFNDASNGDAYFLSFIIVPGTYDPSFDALAVAALTAQEAERLSWFTDRQTEVLQAMLDGQANGRMSNGVPAPAPAPAPAGEGAQLYFRLAEFYRDSDGDGLLDHHERQLGTDPWLSDSDFDGYSDLAELAGNSNATDPASTPGGAGGGSPLPPDEDTDADGFLNDIDADPLDKHVDWEKRGFPRFAVLPVPQSALMVLEAVNNLGGVVMNGMVNAQDPATAHHWQPGDSEPTPLALGDLEIAADVFSHLDENLEPVTAPVVLQIQSAFARDITDTGVIVGEGYFAPPNQGTSSPSGDHVTVALRWTDSESDPELVHPGKADIGDWGDLLLHSRATRVNDEGVIMGEADYAVEKENPAEGEIPYEPIQRPCLWQFFSIGSEGLALYPPEEDPPSPLPAVTGIRRSETRFFGSYEGAAYWDEWADIPSDRFPAAGGATVAAARMPNARSAVAGTQRLMLRSYESVWEPALRTYGSGFSLGEDGTVWTSASAGVELWHPLDTQPLNQLINGTGASLDFVADVTDRNVAIGWNSSQNLILLPIVALVGAEQRQTDFLGVAKFKGGELITLNLDLEPEFNYESDPDRFRVAAYGLPTDAALRVSLLSENLDGLTEYNDPATAITLEYDSQLQAHATEAMFLAGDEPDDVEAGSDIGADNAPEDRSHRIALGGSFVIEQLELNGGTPVNVKAKYEVLERASVTVKIYPVMVGNAPSTLDSVIERLVKVAKERYVQVGLKLNITIEDAVTVPATVTVNGQAVPVDLEDGLAINHGTNNIPSLAPEEEAFLTHLASPSTDDIEVFFIEYFADAATGQELPSMKGLAYFEHSGFDPGPFANTAILVDDPDDPILAHELGHLLTGEGHVDPNYRNLMAPGFPGTANPQNFKRLSAEQQAKILASPLLDD